MPDTLTRIFIKYNLTGQKQSPIVLDIGREGLAALFAELGYTRGAEIGVQKALYSEVLCQIIPGLHLYAVDSWRVYDGYLDCQKQEKFDACREEALERLAPFDCEVIQDWSLEAAKQVLDGSLDFVYIDANHAFVDVVNDIDTWSKKVRPGGIISGHDYTRRRRYIKCQVKQVVDCWTYTFNIRPLFIVTGDERPGNRFSSWFWVNG
jgi:hypothetical protein